VRGTIRDVYVVFKGGDCASLSRFIHPPHRYARFLDPERRLERAMVQAAWIGHTEGQAGFWKAQASLCELLDLLSKSVYVSDETYLVRVALPRPDTRSSLVAAVDNRFRHDLTSRQSLKELAASLHISLSSLCHRYRFEAGLSPMDARLRIRLDAAKNRLMRGQSLKTIAEETGFSDPYHLSKAFKRIMGVSPRQFLKSFQRAGQR
jgi:AraC-like DNA-binding protein